MTRSLSVAFVTMACALSMTIARAHADVKLPHVFGDNMVLQRDMPCPVWGWDQPGQRVAVSIDGNHPVTAVTDAKGHWQLSLPVMKADGKSHVMMVNGSSAVSFSNVAIGEVWLCSGQSNMQMGLTICNDAKEEVSKANYPDIRLMLVPMKTAGLPQADVDAQWKTCTPQSISVGDFGGFSAAAYYFGRRLHEVLKVPVGLIDSSWGGTMIEPWTPAEGFQSMPRFRYISKAIDARTKTMLEEMPGADASTREVALASVGKLNPSQPTAIYNAMIHPLIPFAIRGAIWYQGEANLEFLADGSNYAYKQQALIQGWRSLWKEGDFPFYYVQLAPFDHDSFGYRQLPAFWEAQTAAQSVPHTGMVLTSDITTDLTDIHPKDKKDVGIRLANLALHDTFNRQDIVARGPAFRALQIEGNKAIVSFDHCSGGLTTRNAKPLDWFTLAGADGHFVKAAAKITGPTEVTVWNESIPNPVAVRFAWDRTATPNLRNSAGLPANVFRTDHHLLKSLAFGKPVLASCDAQDDHVPENIVDGIADDSSGWHAASPHQWVQVDLQAIQPINRVTVYPYYDGHRYYQYTVDASVDGKTWKQIVDMSDNTKPATPAGDDHHFATIKARYVRVNMLKNSANPGVHLNELLVFGPK